MRKSILIISFVLYNFTLIQSPLIADEKIQFLAGKSDLIQIFLPKGYCNITEKKTGIEILEKLTLQFSNIKKSSLKPKLIYKDCNKLNDKYPWGYTAIDNQKFPVSKNQKDLFSQISRAAIDETKKFQILKDVNISLKNLNENIGIGSLGTVKKIWEDDNVIIFYSSIKNIIDGREETSVVTASAILHKNYPIFNYIFENPDQHKILYNAQLFLRSAKLTLND